MTRDNFNNERDFETTENSQSTADLSAELKEQLKQAASTATKLFSAQKEKVSEAIPTDKIIEKASSITGIINKDTILEVASKAKSAYGHFKDSINSTFFDSSCFTDDASSIYSDFEHILKTAKSVDPNNKYSKTVITYVLLKDNSMARVLDITLANNDNSKLSIVTVGNDIPFFKANYKNFFLDLEELDVVEVNYEPSFYDIFEKDEFVPNKITVSVTI